MGWLLSLQNREEEDTVCPGGERWPSGSPGKVIPQRHMDSGLQPKNFSQNRSQGPLTPCGLHFARVISVLTTARSGAFPVGSETPSALYRDALPPTSQQLLNAGSLCPRVSSWWCWFLFELLYANDMLIGSPEGNAFLRWLTENLSFKPVSILFHKSHSSWHLLILFIFFLKWAA